MLVLTAEQIRAEERRGVENGLTFEKMMLNAGNNAAQVLMREFPSAERIAVVCGKGRNGGDGFVAARQFRANNKKVYVILACGRPTDELSMKMFERTVSEGILVYDYAKSPESCATALHNSDLLVDAVFGIGFRGKLRSGAAALAAVYNAAKAPKAALDIPSGLCADSGELPELWFHADCTVTMLAKKPVHVLAPACAACGRTPVVKIGFDPAPESAFLTETDRSFVRDAHPERRADAHKGDFGFALSVCGSRNMPGAAILAARAATESGAGLVGAAFPEAAYGALTAQLCEPVFVPCTGDADGGFSADAIPQLAKRLPDASAVLFGCGVGRGDGAAKLLRYLMKNTFRPLIIDADGINLLAENIDVLKERPAPTLLTPHPGEMSRLTGLTAAEINADRIGAAVRFAEKYGVCLLLKGRGTLIVSPDGRRFINPTGNPGMAVGGSGDLLSGIILSLAAQGVPLFEAAVSGAYIHGAAGDIAAREYSMAGTTPLRMLSTLPRVLSQLEKKK